MRFILVHPSQHYILLFIYNCVIFPIEFIHQYDIIQVFVFECKLQNLHDFYASSFSLVVLKTKKIGIIKYTAVSAKTAKYAKEVVVAAVLDILVSFSMQFFEWKLNSGSEFTYHFKIFKYLKTNVQNKLPILLAW